MLGSVNDQIIPKARCDRLRKSQACAVALPAGASVVPMTISRESSIARRFLMLFFHEWWFLVLRMGVELCLQVYMVESVLMLTRCLFRLKNRSAAMRCRSEAQGGRYAGSDYRWVADWQSVQSGLITCWNIWINKCEDYIF